MFDDIHFERRAYDPWGAYGQSKTANVLFAVEATRRWAEDGISTNALMPGGIMTRLQRHVDAATRAEWAKSGSLGDLKMKTPQQGAATSVLLATSPQLEGVSGRYFEDCNEARTVPADYAAGDGVREYAIDPHAARRLWEESLAMLEAPVGVAV